MEPSSRMTWKLKSQLDHLLEGGSEHRQPAADLSAEEMQWIGRSTLLLCSRQTSSSCMKLPKYHSNKQEATIIIWTKEVVLKVKVGPTRTLTSDQGREFTHRCLGGLQLRAQTFSSLLLSLCLSRCFSEEPSLCLSFSLSLCFFSESSLCSLEATNNAAQSGSR